MFGKVRSGHGRNDSGTAKLRELRPNASETRASEVQMENTSIHMQEILTELASSRTATGGCNEEG